MANQKAVHFKECVRYAQKKYEKYIIYDPNLTQPIEHGPDHTAKANIIGLALIGKWGGNEGIDKAFAIVAGGATKEGICALFALNEQQGDDLLAQAKMADLDHILDNIELILV